MEMAVDMDTVIKFTRKLRSLWIINGEYNSRSN